MREGISGLKPFDVYVDSPLSSKATRVYQANFNGGYFDEQAMARKLQGDDPFTFETLHFVELAEDSKALNFMPQSKVHHLVFGHVRGRTHQTPFETQPLP